MPGPGHVPRCSARATSDAPKADRGRCQTPERRSERLHDPAHCVGPDRSRSTSLGSTRAVQDLSEPDEWGWAQRSLTARQMAWAVA